MLKEFLGLSNSEASGMVILAFFFGTMCISWTIGGNGDTCIRLLEVMCALDFYALLQQKGRVEEILNCFMG